MDICRTCGHDGYDCRCPDRGCPHCNQAATIVDLLTQLEAQKAAATAIAEEVTILKATLERMTKIANAYKEASVNLGKSAKGWKEFGELLTRCEHYREALVDIARGMSEPTNRDYASRWSKMTLRAAKALTRDNG